MTVKDIQDYYKKYFTSQNYVIALFGDIDPTLFKGFKETLNKVPNKKALVYSNESLYLKQPIIYYKKKTNVSNLNIVIKLPFDLFDPKILYYCGIK